MAAATKPIHNKLATGGAGGGLVGTIAWILVTFVPAWHTGLPPDLATALPVICGLIGFFATGWLAKDDTRFTPASELQEIELRLLSLLAARGGVPVTVPASAQAPMAGRQAPSAAAIEQAAERLLRPGTMGYGQRQGGPVPSGGIGP